jgi:hypothetical protein
MDDRNRITPTVPEYRRLATPTTVVLACATLVIISLVGAFTVLALYGKTTDDLFKLLNVIMNGASVLLSAGAFTYSGSADRKAGRAVQQTNHQLDDRIERIIRSTVRQIVREELARRGQPPRRAHEKG